MDSDSSTSASIRSETTSRSFDNDLEDRDEEGIEDSDESLDEDSEQLGLLPYQYEPVTVSQDSPEGSNSDLSSSQDEGDGEERLNNTNWCSCGKCEALPTPVENVCCREIPAVDSKRLQWDGDEEISCITEHEGFKTVCLDRWVLQTAGYHVVQEHGPVNGISGPAHKSLRFIAYRQCTRWCWGYLGREIRVVLPSCAVTAIRNNFPSNSYTGFKIC